MCAIHGTSFINSAKDAFNLIQRNLTHTVVVTNVSILSNFKRRRAHFGHFWAPRDVRYHIVGVVEVVQRY